MGTPHTHSLKERSLMASSSQATNLQWPKIVIFLSCGYFPNLALALKSNLQLINKYHISKFNHKHSFGQKHTRCAWEHPHFNYRHNPLTWSGSGSEIQEHSDHGASKELMNPYSGLGFSNSFDELWSEWSWITDPELDHPKGMHPKVIVSLVFSSVWEKTILVGVFCRMLNTKCSVCLGFSSLTHVC